MKILFITSALPWPTWRGGNQRSNLIWQGLAEVGQTHILNIQEEKPSPEEMELLSQKFGYTQHATATEFRERIPAWMAKIFGENSIIRISKILQGSKIDFQRDPDIVQLVRRMHEQHHYDIVVLRSLRLLALSEVHKLAPVIVDIDDLPSEKVESQMNSQQMNWIRSLYWKRWLRSTRALECGLASKCAHAWIAKLEDGKRLSGVSTSVLPNVPFSEPPDSKLDTTLESTREKVILTVGTMRDPHIRGLEIFLRECWPEIRERHPNSRFRIVGPGMTDELRSIWSNIDGVEPVGFCEDLSEEYKNARFAICYHVDGAGTNIKILEALMFGCAVVCTKFGQRGYEEHLRSNIELVVANDGKDFAMACNELLQNPEKTKLLAARGRAAVQRSFTRTGFISHVRRTALAIR